MPVMACLLFLNMAESTSTSLAFSSFWVSGFFLISLMYIIKSAITLKAASPSNSDSFFMVPPYFLGFVRAGLYIHFVRHGILCAHGVVAHEAECKLAFVPVSALKLETAGVQGVQQLDSNTSALGAAVFVRVVAHPPNIDEVGIQQVIAGNKLGRVGFVNICGSHQFSGVFRINCERGTAHRYLTIIQRFQLFHVARAIIDAFAFVRKSRDIRERCAAGSGPQHISRLK